MVPGVEGRAKRAGLAAAAHGELVHVGLAENDRPGRDQALDSRGGVRTEVALQHPAAAGGEGTFEVQVVFNDHRHARERQRFTRCQPLRHPGGLLLGIRVQADQGIECLRGLSAVQGRTKRLLRGEFTARNLGGQLCGGRG